ncbi:MAG: AI-2E family transporter [Candidatus Melainabacteria bacterium]|nr:AI-2E family transporter [Candidatus Melainabacteria bacterium]
MLKWVALCLIIWFLYHIREIFPPFVIGGIFAYLVLPLVRYVHKEARIPMKAAVLAIYVGIAGILFALGWFFGPLLVDQMTNLWTQRQELVNNVVSSASQSFGWQLPPGLADQMVHNLEETFGKPEELMHLTGIFSKSMLGILVCVVSSIYFIIDSHRVGQFFLRFVPEDQRLIVTNITQQTNVMLSRYVRGQLLLITIMSTVAWIFLHFIFKLKYALVIAIASGFLEIIPVLGPIIATSTATIVGVAQHGMDVALGIIICYTLARWTEDYVIIPRIIGHAVELHPLVVIFAVLCGEVTAGALGMLIAIPVAACIKLVVDFLYPPLDASAHKQVDSTEENSADSHVATHAELK